MPRLTVEATHDSQRVRDGTHTPAVLYVSVSDDGGNPVDGLAAAQFKVTVIRAPAIGGEWGESAGPIEIASVSAAGSRAGFYVVGIKPGLTLASGAGRSVVGLAVERKTIQGAIGGPLLTHSGQTLVSFAVTYA